MNLSSTSTEQREDDATAEELLLVMFYALYISRYSVIFMSTESVSIPAWTKKVFCKVGKRTEAVNLHKQQFERSWGCLWANS